MSNIASRSKGYHGICSTSKCGPWRRFFWTGEERDVLESLTDLDILLPTDFDLKGLYAIFSAETNFL